MVADRLGEVRSSCGVEHAPGAHCSVELGRSAAYVQANRTGADHLPQLRGVGSERWDLRLGGGDVRRQLCLLRLSGRHALGDLARLAAGGIEALFRE